MNDQYDDRKIAADFQQLRQLERGHAPRFSSLLMDVNESKPRFRQLQPLAALSVVVLTLSLLSFALLRPGFLGETTDFSAESMRPENREQLSLPDEMPTDFLLETPWSQLTNLESETRLTELSDDFLEDLTDET